MKHSFSIIALILFQMTGRGQKPVFNFKSQALPAGLMILAGAADAWNQVVQFKYPAFKKAFPGISDRWYNPKISGANKYKGGKEVNGEKFFGSTTAFVAVTDAYHCSRFLERLFIVGAITVKITGDKRKWYWYLVESAIYWTLNRATFTLIYSRF